MSHLRSLLPSSLPFLGGRLKSYTFCNKMTNDTDIECKARRDGRTEPKVPRSKLGRIEKGIKVGRLEALGESVPLALAIVAHAWSTSVRLIRMSPVS